MHPNDVRSLDAWTFTNLWEAITVIEAQKFLIDVKVTTIMNLKKSDRAKLLREMHKAAYPRGFSPENATLTAKQLAEKLAKRAKHGRR